MRRNVWSITKGVKRTLKVVVLSSVLTASVSFGLVGRVQEAQAAVTDYNYAEALQKSILFYDAQRSGKLPENNRLNWRGDSGLQDGMDVGHDLTGGWYDAGDHVKFGLPMAYSATMLAWSVYEYREAYEQTGQLEYMLDNIKWATDYFIKAHTGPNEFYGQVGNGTLDHNWWGPAEVMPMPRPAYKIDAQHPGSDLAAGTAAALAAASIIFEETDAAYSQLLLQHAKELYQFADTYRGKYSDSITDARDYYNSWSGYEDELMWGAVWLYLATEDENYLNKARSVGENILSWGYEWAHNWDDVHKGAQLLMARITNDHRYIQAVENHLDYWSVGVNGRRITYTPGGLAYLDQWGALRYASTTAYLAFVYSDWVQDPAKQQRYRDFATSQILYILGDNPRNSSYVVGFGNNPPQRPHHRTAHGSYADSLDIPSSHRHILYGALVGGPNADDSYEDDVRNYINNEVATDYNAGFTGALAKMYLLYGQGQQPLSNFPQPEPVTEDEIFVEAGINTQGANFTEIKAILNNRSAWPARMGDKLSFKYFVDLSEVYAAGYTANDIRVTTHLNEGAQVSQLQAWDASKHLYYVDIDFTGVEIYPGGQSAHKKEVQFRIAAPAGTNFWNAANDYSYQGLTAQVKKTPYIPVYDGGVLEFGEEPGSQTEPQPDPDPGPGPGPDPDPDPQPVPEGDLIVEYLAADTNPYDNQIKPHFNIVNRGSTAVNLSDLKLRYYFSKDGGQAMNAWIDWAQIGSSHIQSSFTDEYVELSFTSQAGRISPNGESGPIQLRMSKNDWSNFDETNDYSFNPSITSFAPWERVTLYLNGQLVWGIEP